MSPLRIVAAVFMVAALVVLVAADQDKLFGILLVIGNLLIIFENFITRRSR